MEFRYGKPKILIMNWPESLATLFGFMGIALLFHGFPTINIGGHHEKHIHYHNGEEIDEDSEEE